MFFFYIGGWSVIRRSLVVNLCQSVLDGHNEQMLPSATADLKCKALRVVKRARSVQGPTLSADAIENFGTQSSLVRVTLRHASPTQRSSRRALHRLFRVASKRRPLDCISSSAVVFKRPLLLQLFSLLCLPEHILNSATDHKCDPTCVAGLRTSRLSRKDLNEVLMPARRCDITAPWQHEDPNPVKKWIHPLQILNFLC